MDNINFQPIIEYIDTKIETVRQEMATKSDVERILGAIDAVAKQAKDHDDKITILQYKSEKAEKWITQAAEKTEIPYEP